MPVAFIDEDAGAVTFLDEEPTSSGGLEFLDEAESGSGGVAFLDKAPAAGTPGGGVQFLEEGGEEVRAVGPLPNFPGGIEPITREQTDLAVDKLKRVSAEVKDTLSPENLKDMVWKKAFDPEWKPSDEFGYVSEQSASIAMSFIDAVPSMLRGLRGLEQQGAALVGGEEELEKTKEFIRGLPIIGKISQGVEGVVDASGNLKADVRQQLRKEAEEQGGKTGVVVSELVNTVEDTVAFLMSMRLGGIKIGESPTASTKLSSQILSRLGQAGKLGAFKALFSEADSLKDRATIGAITTAYMSTPAASGLLKGALPVFVTDLALNSAISATEYAKIWRSPEMDDLDKLVETIKVAGADVVFSAMTKTMRIGDAAGTPPPPAVEVREQPRIDDTKPTPESKVEVPVEFLDEQGNLKPAGPVEVAERLPEVGTKVPFEKEIPLGVRRLPVIDANLKSIEAAEFDKQLEQVERDVYEAEKVLDDRDLTRSEKKNLAVLQDRLSSYELENYRRQLEWIEPWELVIDLKEAIRSGSNENKIRAAMIMSAVNQRNLSVEVQAEIKRVVGDDADKAEVWEGILEDAQMVMGEFGGQKPKAKPIPESKKQIGAAFDDTKPALESKVEFLDEQGNLKPGGTVEGAERLPEVGKPEVKELPAEGQKIRRFAERVAADAGLSEDEAARIIANPESYYRPQTYVEINARLSLMTPEELAVEMARPADADAPSERNISVLAGLELMNRKAAAGEDTVQVVEGLSKKLTNAAQILRQAAELKSSSPAFALGLFEKELQKHNRFLTESQRAGLQRLIDADFAATRAFREADDAFRASTTDETAAARDAAFTVAETAKRAMMNKMASYTPRTGADIFRNLLRGNLLVPISQSRNITSNVIMQIASDTGQSLAATVDAIDSYVRQRPRATGLPSLPGRVIGAVKGAKSVVKDIIHGSQVDPLLHGEAHRGFQPLRAWAQIFSGDMPVNSEGKIAAKDYFKKVVEGTLGLPAEVNFRALALGDVPFKQSTMESLVREQANLRKLKGAERRKFITSPPPAVQRLIVDESLVSVFQQKNMVGGAWAGIQKYVRSKGAVGDWFDAAVITPQFPYIKTPLNLAHQAVYFAAPAYSLARAGYFANQARSASGVQKTALRRKSNQALGYAAVGQMMMSAGAWMAVQGLVSAPPDKDPKKRALQYATFKPNSINLTGLQRAMAGDDPAWQAGDKTQNLFWLGFLGINFNVAAARQRARQDGRDQLGEAAEEDAGKVSQLVSEQMAIVPEIVSAMTEMTMLKGTYNILDSINRKEYDRLIQNYYRAVTSTVLPNTLSAVVRAETEYLPNMKTDNQWKMFLNAVNEKNPFIDLNEMYPHRYDPLGDPIQRTPEGSNSWVYHLVDLAKSEQISDDPVWGEIGKLYRETADAKVIPSTPSASLMWAGKPYALSPEDHGRRIQLVGEQRRRILDPRLTSPGWDRIKPEKKIELIGDMLRKGTERGNKLFVREMRDKYKTWFSNNRRPPSPLIAELFADQQE